MGIRLFLIVTCSLLAAIPAIIFWAGPQANLKNFEVELATDRHQRIAEELAGNLASYGFDVNAIVSLVARNSAQSVDLETASALLSTKHIRRVCVYDASTLKLTRSILAGPASCEPFLQTKTHQGLRPFTAKNISRFTPIQTDHMGDSVIFLPQRLAEEFVVAAVDPGFIEALGNSVRFGAKGHVAVVDHAGNVLSHPKQEWADSHKNLTSIDAFKEVIDGKIGVKHFYSPALKAKMIAGTARVPVFDWGVLVPQPVHELHEIVDRFNTNSVIVICFGLLLALLTALTASKLIGGPIQSFTRAATAVSSGDLDANFPQLNTKTTPRELLVANAALKKMTHVLQKNSADLEHAASSDSLTGLPNRKSLIDTADGLLEKSKTQNTPFGILFIDLNRFKSINDRYGHRYGDELLVEVSSRLQRLLNKKQSALAQINLTSARLGGDEFVVVTEGLKLEQIQALAGEIVDAFAKPFSQNKQDKLGCSIGITTRTSQVCQLTDLLHCADLAMYQAKDQGENQIVVFDDICDAQTRANA